jgi:hypothetical protein
MTMRQATDCHKEMTVLASASLKNRSHQRHLEPDRERYVAFSETGRLDPSAVSMFGIGDKRKGGNTDDTNAPPTM